MGDEHLALLLPIRAVWSQERAKSGITSITPSLYNRHKNATMPHASTIMEKTGKSWRQILEALDIPPTLSRNTLARLSASLHLLQKHIIDILDIGWQEIAFPVRSAPHKKVRKMRPDSLCMERLYLQNNRLLLVDVKLSIDSGAITVYKYLPIFENGMPEEMALARQHTFFPDWLPSNALNLEPMGKSPTDGQIEMFRENHVLYICYLVGQSLPDILPGSGICDTLKGKSRKWKTKQNAKKLPLNMEVRFVSFFALAELYCQIGGIEYSGVLQKQVQPILDIATILAQLAQTARPTTAILAQQIYHIVKNSASISGEVANLVQKIYQDAVRTASPS